MRVILTPMQNIENTNLNPREIAYFQKFAKIYTRENIYVHSRSRGVDLANLCMDVYVNYSETDPF